MEDIYSNPPSVASSVACPSGKGAKISLKLEKSKKGQVDVKAGHKIWEAIPIDIREDIATYMDMDTELAENGGKGERIFSEVKEFFELPMEPKVKQMRASIPKAVLLLFHTDQVADGREKIRDMWDPAKCPEDWDPTVKFVDPNNGNKLAKTELLKVYSSLKRYFKNHESELRNILGLDMERSVEQSPARQKALSSLKRAQRELDYIIKKMDLTPLAKEELKTLRSWLEGIQIRDDHDVLKTFDIASSTQRLMLEIEMTTKSPAAIIESCRGIYGSFEKRQSLSTVQPTSEDVGQRYLHTMDSPLHLKADPMIVPKTEVEEVKDLKDLTDVPAPCFTVETSDSAAIDASIRSPEINLEQPAYDLSGGDFLSMLCRDLEIDKNQGDVIPQKKMKTGTEFYYMDFGNTVLEGIQSVSELGGKSAFADIDTSNRTFIEVSSDPVLQKVVDEIQADPQVASMLNNTKTQDLQGGNQTWGSGFQFFTQPMLQSADTQMIGTDLPFMAEAPLTMIPTTVEGMEVD